MEAEDGGSGFHCQEHRTLLRNIFGPSRAIDGERRVPAFADSACQLDQRAEPTTGARASSRAISKSPDALSDRLAIPVHAGHDDDATFAPVVRCGEDSAVPESKDRAISGLINFFQVGVAFRLPTNSAADDVDDEVADPTDEPGLDVVHQPPNYTDFADL